MPFYAARSAAANDLDSDGDAFIAYNPGIDSCEGYLAEADVLILFEDTGTNALAWSGPAWVGGYASSRFWLLAHSTAATDLLSVVDRARANNAGWIYVTDDELPNPWDASPTYLAEEIALTGS